MMARRGQEVLQGVLNELLRYTEKHFSGEEPVMRSAGYPQLPAQIEQHRRFTDKIKELSAKYQAGGVGMSRRRSGFPDRLAEEDTSSAWTNSTASS